MAKDKGAPEETVMLLEPVMGARGRQKEKILEDWTGPSKQVKKTTVFCFEALSWKGKEFRVGQGVYFSNPQNVWEPSMLKITDITSSKPAAGQDSGDSDEDDQDEDEDEEEPNITITGRWLYPGYQTALTNMKTGNANMITVNRNGKVTPRCPKETLKDLHSIHNDEVLFSSDDTKITQEIFITNCIGSFSVVSRDDFKSLYPRIMLDDTTSTNEILQKKNPKKITGKGRIDADHKERLPRELQDKVFFCHRAIYKGTNNLYLEFTWEEGYIKNEVFQRASRLRETATVTPSGKKAKPLASGPKNRRNSISRPVNDIEKEIAGKEDDEATIGVNENLRAKKSVQAKKDVNVKKVVKNKNIDKVAYKQEQDEEESESGSGSESEAEEDDESSSSEEDVSDCSEDDEGGDSRSKKRRGSSLSKKKATIVNKKRLTDVSTVKSSVKRKTAGNDFERATEQLHLATIPDSLPCREGEFEQLYADLEYSLRNDGGLCMYISGTPGTGKTATVKAVLRALQEQVEMDELDSFEFIEINGMRLSEPGQAYTTLWEGLTGSRVSPAYAEEALGKMFKAPSSNRAVNVVLIDEIDLLITKRQSVIYNFFDWPHYPTSRLIVIAIANTMDLPERFENKIVSRMGLHRMQFTPYSMTDLEEIVSSRLAGLDCFMDEAVKYSGRVIAHNSGDARRCLDICRRAVELFVEDSRGSERVAISHIKAAIAEMTESTTVKIIASLSFHQKLFLLACIKQGQGEGLSEVSVGRVIEEHSRHCQMHSVVQPSVSSMYSICAMLSASNLIHIEGSRFADPTQTLRMVLQHEDVYNGICPPKETKGGVLHTIVKTMRTY